MKMKKVLALLLCAVLLVTGSVLATLAYLTDTETVTNTFTVGKVGISLDEADVKTDGTLESTIDSRVQANEYHLLPGHTYIKDPVVHIDSDSENCWIFVKLENGLKGIIDATTIENQMVANGWTLLSGSTDTYYYKEIVGKGMNIPTFTEFKVVDDVVNTDLATYASKTINVTAYAVQADGFATAQAAWNATFGAPTT